ncbi:DsbA family oxidoreductase [Roseomonas sp. M0104]|uniref:DsbA family oxidoreductase n=1 Tax=Teichococcus coralli TaxID=2545983 RepID=A0A845B9L6_9PROT|nr:DsbA family oxidoreductase [Pseudoroseomonas coralli]MXP63871.1 DsbA family oxidoreductase [Pseudoroseomonas coralli]
MLDAVNLLSPSRNQLEIEVVFDLVCPWCFLGTRRLRRALSRRPDIVAAIRWRPFLLNPDLGAGGLARQDYLARKFGGEERARRLHSTVTDLGRAEDIAFRFDLIRRVPPSLDAHRTVRFASQHGVAEAVVDAVFTAYFCEGADIGDRETLSALGAAQGLDQRTLLRFLASGLESEAVHAENLRAHRLGINGVPCFVVAGRQGLGAGHAIAGAQEPEVLERLMDVAVAEAMEF